MKRAQAGSAGPVIVLAIVAAVVWWQWPRISGLIGSRQSAGGPAVVEVLDYRCDRHTDGTVQVKGSLRNVSNTAVGLWAVNQIGFEGSGMKAQVTQAPVKPKSVAPGATGSFEAEGPPLPEAGFCKLHQFLDAADSKALGFTGRDLANFAKR